jgi:hypothetical protein
MWEIVQMERLARAAMPGWAVAEVWLLEVWSLWAKG